MIRSVDARVDVLRNGAVLTQLRASEEEAPHIRMRSSASIKSSLTGSFRPNTLVDWLRDELRPVLILDGVEHPMGRFAPATVTFGSVDGKRQVQVEAYDRCWRVESTRSEKLVHLAAGTNYIDAIKTLLARSGISLVLATPCASVLSTDREDWNLGESTLTIVNQLLDEINYKSLWFDAAGFAVLEPKSRVTAENIVRSYDAGNSKLLMHDRVSAQMDLYNAPNVFLCVCSNPGGAAPMCARAENNNPASPLSIIRRGRRIAQTYKIRNIADQAALQEYADLLCQDSMLLGTTVEISTAPMPGCGVDDVVALVHPDMEGLCREVEWEVDLCAGGTMTHKLEKAVMQL